MARKSRASHLPNSFDTMTSPNDEMVSRPAPSALKFDLIAKCAVSRFLIFRVLPTNWLTNSSQTTKARAATLMLPHGPVQLPIFMPVATQASLKGLTPKQLEETGCRLCLNNTYHLGLKPGQEVLDVIGGAHKLQSWPHNILTGMA